MDKQEAQFILSAYRPDAQDAGDGRFSEALELVNEDQGLKAWFESEVSKDRIIADKLKQVRPPAGLRDQILTGMNMADQAPPWWRRAPVMAIAATIIVVFGMMLSWNRPTYDSEYDELRANAVSYAAGFISLDFFSENLVDLTTWLSERDAPGSVDLVGQLESMPGIGCRTLSWSGKTVSLICLQGDTIYHVFMVDRDEVPDNPTSETPQIWQMKRRTVVSWSDDQRTYIMVTKATPDEVRALL